VLQLCLVIWAFWHISALVIKLGKLLCRLQIYQYEDYVTMTLHIIMLRCYQVTVKNKCIGDDTKAAAHQSLNCIKNKKNKIWWKRFSLWRMEFLHPAMWHDHDIDFARWLHPAIWHLALELLQWIHQVAAACNVICDSGMTCHWILPNVRHIGILHLVLISTHRRSRHVILHQSPKFYPNRTTLGRIK